MFSWLFGSRPPAPFLCSEEEIAKEVAGKSFLIVGGTKGLGAGAAKALAKRNAKVTVVGRSASPELLENSNITFKRADLSTVTAMKEFVKTDLAGQKFDSVLFTTGIITRPTLTRTADGIEEDFAISYLSRFVILNEIVKAKTLNGRKRVYIWGYPGQDLKPHALEDINYDKDPSQYKQFPAHMNTVIFNEALVYEAARRFPDLRVYGVNPGLIQTGIRDNFHGGSGTILGGVVERLIALFNWDTDQYTEKTVIHLLGSAKLQSQNAISVDQQGYEVQPKGWTKEESNRIKAWEISEQILRKVLD